MKSLIAFSANYNTGFKCAGCGVAIHFHDEWECYHCGCITAERT